MGELRNRSTRQVIEDHLANRQRGDVEADLARNYDPDVLVMTSRGTFRGHDGIRRLQKALRREIGDASYEFPTVQAEGPYAFIEWRARRPGKSVEDGADSFVVRDGRIAFQSIHYMIEETMPI